MSSERSSGLGVTTGSGLMVGTSRGGPLVGLPLTVARRIRGYGGNWQTAINVGYGLALGLTLTGSVILVFGALGW